MRKDAAAPASGTGGQQQEQQKEHDQDDGDYRPMEPHLAGPLFLQFPLQFPLPPRLQAVAAKQAKLGFALGAQHLLVQHFCRRFQNLFALGARDMQLFRGL